MISERRVRAAPGTKVVRTVCSLNCGIACGVLAHVRDGRLIKVEPSDHTGTSNICLRGLSASRLVYHPDRLKHPLKRQGARGEGKWEQISWDEALDIIAANLKEIGEKYGTNSLAFVNDQVGALTTTAVLGFTGACGGTFIDPSGCGDVAGPCADKVCYGSSWWYGEDYTCRFDNPASIFVWGENPAETKAFKWRGIRDAKEEGTRLIVIDPRFTTTASKADEFVPLRTGTDAALALGMMNPILTRGLEDKDFIAKHTIGPFLVRSDTGMLLREKDIASGESEKYVVWDTRVNEAKCHDEVETEPALKGTYKVNGIECSPAFQLLADLVQQYTPEKASEVTGVPAQTIERLGMEYATNKPVASLKGLGGTRGNIHGDLNFRAICTLAAITGNISFEGRDSSEVNMAALMTRGFPGVLPLLTLYEAVSEDKPYPIRSLFVARHNPFNQYADFNRIIGELVPRLDFIVVADLFMSTTAQYADIVLPASSTYESTDIYSPIGDGSHNYLQLQPKVIEPLHESRSDLDILASIAAKMGMDEYMDKSPEEYIDQMLASGHPSTKGITVSQLKEKPVQPNHHAVQGFGTPSGRFEFYTESLKSFGQELPVYLEPMESPGTPKAKNYPLTVLTAHPKYRVHSMFANVPWIREIDRGPVLEINPTDAKSRGIDDGDVVRIFNDRGEAKLPARVNPGIRPGSINICQGWSPQHFIGGTLQALTHETINPAQQAIYQPNIAQYDTLAEVERTEEVRADG
jgi:anaerobic selenocysteine-containing dehydrogenase